MAVDAVAKVKKLLQKRLRVTLVGGRVLSGTFQALDKQGNLVLGHAVEHMGPERGEERHVGMVLIPEQQRQCVELQVKLDDEMSMMNLSV